MDQEKEENVKHIIVNGYKVNLYFGEYNPTLAATIKDMLLDSLVDRINGMQGNCDGRSTNADNYKETIR